MTADPEAPMGTTGDGGGETDTGDGTAGGGSGPMGTTMSPTGPGATSDGGFTDGAPGGTGDTDEGTEDGCSCRSTTDDNAMGWLFLGLLPLLSRRRFDARRASATLRR